MRNRPMGRRLDNPVPSFARYGPTCRSSQRSTFEPSTIPAAPTPSRPRNTLLPTGVPSIPSGYGRTHPLDRRPDVSTFSEGKRSLYVLFAAENERAGEIVTPSRQAGGMEELAISALTEAQHGLVTLGQARSAGLPDTAVKRRLTSGRWLRVHGAVYG